MGATERVAHLFMLALFVTTAVLVFLLGREWLGTTGGAMGAYLWLTLPVVLEFRDLASQQALAMLFIVAALLAFERERAWPGFMLLLLAVFSAWEAALVAPAMWLVSRSSPERRRLAGIAMLATATGLLSVAALFVFRDPQSARDTIHTAEFYMGLSQMYSHVNLVQQTPLPLAEQLRLTLLNNVWSWDPWGLEPCCNLLSRGLRTL
jgi:asparagine N-glycosylation enzyme membrane subunit Stt3